MYVYCENQVNLLSRGLYTFLYTYWVFSNIVHFIRFINLITLQIPTILFVFQKLFEPKMGQGNSIFVLLMQLYSRDFLLHIHIPF